MPRRPTGKPTGRPPGSGKLGPKIRRLTFTMPYDLFTRLEAFCAGRDRYGMAEFSSVLREALEHYLHCPQKRQTGRAPSEDTAPAITREGQREQPRTSSRKKVIR